MTAIEQVALMSGPDRVRVVTFAKGSTPRSELIPRWQWLLWSRQIANFYDRIRCDPGLQISPDLTSTLAPDSHRRMLTLQGRVEMWRGRCSGEA
ncbi:hypothetical protein JZU69_04955, partial [bacterium]|nr:hypothetical protein [bacterium]